MIFDATRLCRSACSRVQTTTSWSLDPTLDCLIGMFRSRRQLSDRKFRSHWPQGVSEVSVRLSDRTTSLRSWHTRNYASSRVCIFPSAMRRCLMHDYVGRVLATPNPRSTERPSSLRIVRSWPHTIVCPLENGA